MFNFIYFMLELVWNTTVKYRYPIDYHITLIDNTHMVVKDIKIDEKVLFQNNCKADLQNEISVGSFDKWSPYTGTKKTSKLKAFVK